MHPVFACNQFFIATSHLEYQTTKHYKSSSYSHFVQITKQSKQKLFQIICWKKPEKKLATTDYGSTKKLLLTFQGFKIFAKTWNES